MEIGQRYPSRREVSGRGGRGWGVISSDRDDRRILGV